VVFGAVCAGLVSCTCMDYRSIGVKILGELKVDNISSVCLLGNDTTGKGQGCVQAKLKVDSST
jgi:hypothetical protein